MQMPTVALTLFGLTFAACGGDDDPVITWRLPCGATGSEDGTVVHDYRYEHDDRGNLTHSEQHDRASGMLLERVTAQYEGDLITEYEVAGEYANFRVTQEVSGNRVVRTVFTGESDDGADQSYTMTWTWSGPDLVETTLDYVSADNVDLTERFERTPDGFKALACALDAMAQCSLYTWSGPVRYVGDFDRYTRFTSDPENAGLVEEQIDRTLDAHYLVLTSVSFSPQDGSASDPFVRETYERESDGTALRHHVEFPTFSYSYATEYAFECPEARQASGAARISKPLRKHFERAPRPGHRPQLLR